MKSFFEEYGFVMLTAIVVVLLISMTGVVGEKVEEGLSGVVDSFSEVATNEFDAITAG